MITTPRKRFLILLMRDMYTHCNFAALCSLTRYMFLAGSYLGFWTYAYGFRLERDE